MLGAILCDCPLTNLHETTRHGCEISTSIKMWTYQYRSHGSNVSDNLITIWANIDVIMGLVRLSSVCVCDVKIDQHQNNLIKGKNMIKIKKRTLLRIVADVVVDKDVLQSVSRFFCPKTTFPLVRKGKMCYQNNNSKNNNKVIWLGTIFAAENEIWYDICVLVLREKKKQARTHTHPRAHERHEFISCDLFCFVPKNIR